MREMGKGEPMLLLAGAGGSGAVFLGLARRWRDNYRCLMPDMEPPYETEAAAHAMVRRLDAVGVASFHVTGVSLGGCIAQQIAAQYPERVLSLTLCATFARLEGEGRERVARLREDRLSLADEAFLPRWMDYLYGDTPRPSLRAMDTPAEVFAAQLDAALAHDGRPLLSAIACPVRVTYGRDDRLILPELTIALADGILGAECEAYPGGHMHWLDLKTTRELPR